MSDNINGFNRSDVVLLSGSSNVVLAQKIAKILKLKLYVPVSKFADGEIRVRIPVNLRRRHVFIIQSTSAPVNDNLMELILMIDAARRASAQEITAVIPYFGYSRQDRKEMPRVPISSSVVSGIIAKSGVSRILTIDIHSEQQQGFITVPWDNLYGSYSLTKGLKKNNYKNLVIASPDKNGMAKAIKYAQLLGADGVAVVYKERDVSMSNQSKALDMIGVVKDRDVLIVDDIIDTAGTITNAADYLASRGARKIYVAATHGLFSGPAYDRINKSKISEVYITDTVNLSSINKISKKTNVMTVSDLVAEAIKRIVTGDSISRDLIL